MEEQGGGEELSVRKIVSKGGVVFFPSTSPLPPTTAYAPELRQGELHAHTTSSTECLTQARPTKHQTPARRTGSAHCRTMCSTMYLASCRRPRRCTPACSPGAGAIFGNPCAVFASTPLGGGRRATALPLATL